MAPDNRRRGQWNRGFHRRDARPGWGGQPPIFNEGHGNMNPQGQTPPFIPGPGPTIDQVHGGPGYHAPFHPQQQAPQGNGYGSSIAGPSLNAAAYPMPQPYAGHQGYGNTSPYAGPHGYGNTSPYSGPQGYGSASSYAGPQNYGNAPAYANTLGVVNHASYPPMPAPYTGAQGYASTPTYAATPGSTNPIGNAGYSDPLSYSMPPVRANPGPFVPSHQGHYGAQGPSDTHGYQGQQYGPGLGNQFHTVGYSPSPATYPPYAVPGGPQVPSGPHIPTGPHNGGIQGAGYMSSNIPGPEPAWFHGPGPQVPRQDGNKGKWRGGQQRRPSNTPKDEVRGVPPQDSSNQGLSAIPLPTMHPLPLRPAQPGKVRAGNTSYPPVFTGSSSGEGTPQTTSPSGYKIHQASPKIGPQDVDLVPSPGPISFPPVLGPAQDHSSSAQDPSPENPQQDKEIVKSAQPTDPTPHDTVNENVEKKSHLPTTTNEAVVNQPQITTVQPEHPSEVPSAKEVSIIQSELTTISTTSPTSPTSNTAVMARPEVKSAQAEQSSKVLPPKEASIAQPDAAPTLMGNFSNTPPIHEAPIAQPVLATTEPGHPTTPPPAKKVGTVQTKAPTPKPGSSTTGSSVAPGATQTDAVAGSAQPPKETGAGAPKLTKRQMEKLPEKQPEPTKAAATGPAGGPAATAQLPSRLAPPPKATPNPAAEGDRWMGMIDWSKLDAPPAAPATTQAATKAARTTTAAKPSEPSRAAWTSFAEAAHRRITAAAEEQAKKKGSSSSAAAASSSSSSSANANANAASALAAALFGSGPFKKGAAADVFMGATEPDPEFLEFAKLRTITDPGFDPATFQYNKEVTPAPAPAPAAKNSKGKKGKGKGKGAGGGSTPGSGPGPSSGSAL